MRDAVRISMVGAAAWLLVAAMTAGPGCAPDAVLGGLGGTSPSSSSGTGTSTSASSGTVGTTASSSSTTSAGSTSSSSGTGVADAGCTGVDGGCTGAVIWAQAISPTNGNVGDMADDAPAVTISMSGDVFAAGRTGDFSGITYNAGAGFLVDFKPDGSTFNYVDAIGNGSLLNAGTAVAYDVMNDRVLLTGFCDQGTTPFDLGSAGSFVVALTPGNGMPVGSSQSVTGDTVAVVVGPGQVPVTLSGNCALTVAGGQPQDLIVNGTRTCHGLAYDDGAPGVYYVVGSFMNTISYNNGAPVSPLSSELSMFVAQVTTTGSVGWHQEASSPNGPNEALGVAVGSGGGAVVTGRFSGTFDTGGSIQIVYAGSGQPNAFVVELEPVAGNLVGGFAFSGDQSQGRGVAVDGSGDIVVVGDFTGNLALPSGGPLSSVSGSSDVFVVRLADTTPMALRWSLQLGDTGNQLGEAVAIGPQGDLAISGQFDGTLPFGIGTQSISAPMGTGAYVMRLVP